eukprot:GHVL01006621.1.p1 GENE.GHVL01006621.1~~GHVL01006621.1.p1  ORF type:complete len:316 (-),score=91.05 GHVL01006621.1:1520-2467(-)
MLLSAKSDKRYFQQVRWHIYPRIKNWTPPSKRNWSKQHSWIRTPRPLVTKNMIDKTNPNKEWWRERRNAPKAFMGFPDIAELDKTGGSIYAELMDPLTLSIIMQRGYKIGLNKDNVNIQKLVKRCSDLSYKLEEPYLCLLFRILSYLDIDNNHLYISLISRIIRRIRTFDLCNIYPIISGLINKNYYNKNLFINIFHHLECLLDEKDDFRLEDLVDTLISIGYLTESGVNYNICTNNNNNKYIYNIYNKISYNILDRNISILSLETISILIYTCSYITKKDDLTWQLLREAKDRLKKVIPPSPGIEPGLPSADGG